MTREQFASAGHEQKTPGHKPQYRRRTCALTYVLWQKHIIMKTHTPSLGAPVAARTSSIAFSEPTSAHDAPPPPSPQVARAPGKHFLGMPILSGHSHGRRGEPQTRSPKAARMAEFLLSRSIFLQVFCLCPWTTALLVAFTLTVSPAQADTFGKSTNQFAIGFVPINQAGNAADSSGYGAVPYQYRMSTYEISQDDITRATASGMAGVTAGAWKADQPAADISWYEAAAFVNWMNTSTGKQAAYNLTFDGGAWGMKLWSSQEAWTAGGTNLFRNKDATYFLPSENEWYKAAYYHAAGANYFLYPTESSTAPVAVDGGTRPNTAVYNKEADVPAGVDVAGALSAYGTMGQGGNVWEWTETAASGANNAPSERRVGRGGGWDSTEDVLRSSFRAYEKPSSDRNEYGFRVASIPEPSTFALLLGASAIYLYVWLKRAR